MKCGQTYYKEYRVVPDINSNVVNIQFFNKTSVPPYKYENSYSRFKSHAKEKLSCFNVIILISKINK